MFDSDREWIPDLERMAPGIELAAVLTAVDVGRLSGYDKVVVLRAHQRMAAHHAAQTYRAMASLIESMDDAHEDPAGAAQAAATEVRAALHLTRRAADSEVDFALEFGRLPRVWQALDDGLIDLRKARMIIRLTTHLSDDGARAVVEEIIDEAARLTTGQLHARIRRLCVEVDPDDAADRYQDAVSKRRVVIEPTIDGTAHLMALELAPDRVSAVARRLNGFARALKTASEDRTMDQLRADVLVDLLSGERLSGGGSRGRSAGAGPRGDVDIRVDLETLAGLADAPGELAGYGPVIADIARQVTDDQGSSQWRFTVTDPDSGQPVATGTTRRRPVAAQRRSVGARYDTCVFPGCRMPAAACDLDHRDPWAEGGATTTDNLAPLCRHDHINRHERGWSYERIEQGDHRWTSPLGHSYTTTGRPP